MQDLIKESASVITPAIDLLINHIAELKKSRDSLRIAIIRTGAGTSSLACAGLLDQADELHLFDYEDKVRQLAHDLRNYPCQLVLHGHSHKLYDSHFWQLAKMLNGDSAPGIKFDLIFMDGPGLLWQDGLALYLVKNLLNPSAILIFAQPKTRYGASSQEDTQPFPQILDVMTAEQLNTSQQQMAIDILLNNDSAFQAIENEDSCAIFRYSPLGDASSAIRQEAVRNYFISNFLSKLSPEAINAIRAQATLPVLINAINGSGLYDTEKYLEENPDVKDAGLDPIAHFLQFGIGEGRLLKEKKHKSPSPIILRTGSAEAFSGMPLHVNWGITDMCNYKCSYCFGQKPLDRSRFSSYQQLKKAVDHIAELNRDHVNFTFSGGEPTTHPHLGELIEYIHKTFTERLQHVTLISNGSNNPELYDHLANTDAIDRLCFIISLHTEFMKLEHIKALIRQLSHKSTLHFALMFHPHKKDFVKEIHAELCRQRASYPFNLGITLLRGGSRFDRIDERYVADDFEWQKQAVADFASVSANGPKITHLSPRGYTGGIFWNYTDPKKPYKKMTTSNRSALLSAGNFNFKDMYCVTGSSVLCIEQRGYAYGAQCPQARAKYNIYHENPYRHEDFIAPVRCSAANCGCAANDSIPKFASEEEAMDFATMYNFRQSQRISYR